MQRYHWPGNIRELENLIRRYVILGSEQVIGSELLAKVPTEFNPEQLSGESVSLKKLSRQAAREVERRIILRALEVNGWNRKLAARSLNISYRALLYKIKQGGMPPKRSVSSRAPVPVSFED
jgi:two-component system response regulator AtoC